MELTELLKELAITRAALEQQKTWRKSMLEAVTETPEYKAVEESEKNLATKVSELEAHVRQMAIENYANTKEKKMPGVSIRILNKVSYDTKLAIAWCFYNLQDAIKLDAAKFDKAAKAAALDTLNFVERYEETSAAIDSDLSAFIE